LQASPFSEISNIEIALPRITFDFKHVLSLCFLRNKVKSKKQILAKKKRLFICQSLIFNTTANFQVLLFYCYLTSTIFSYYKFVSGKDLKTIMYYSGI